MVEESADRNATAPCLRPPKQAERSSHRRIDAGTAGDSQQHPLSRPSPRRRHRFPPTRARGNAPTPDSTPPATAPAAPRQRPAPAPAEDGCTPAPPASADSRPTATARVAVASWKRQHWANRYPRKKRRSLQAHVDESVAVHTNGLTAARLIRCDPACVVRAGPARAPGRAVVRIDLRRGCRLRDRRSAGADAAAAGVQRRTRPARQSARARRHRGRPGHRRQYGPADDRVESPRFATAAARRGQVRAVRRRRGQLDDPRQGAVSAGRDA